MSDLATRKATYADLEAVPPHLVAEILFGVLETHPRPMAPHSVAALSLGDELVGPFQKGRGGPGGWVFMIEPQLHLGVHVVVPDIAGWRRERLPRLPGTVGIMLAPDWVCEVLSPSTARVDRIVKARVYAAADVPFYWLLDPIARTLEAMTLQDGQWVQTAAFTDDDLVEAAPFSAAPFRLSELWPLPLASDSN
jgi:Uma2 family endonuclease